MRFLCFRYSFYFLFLIFFFCTNILAYFVAYKGRFQRKNPKVFFSSITKTQLYFAVNKQITVICRVRVTCIYTNYKILRYIYVYISTYIYIIYNYCVKNTYKVIKNSKYKKLTFI